MRPKPYKYLHKRLPRLMPIRSFTPSVLLKGEEDPFELTDWIRQHWEGYKKFEEFTRERWGIGIKSLYRFYRGERLFHPEVMYRIYLDTGVTMEKIMRHWWVIQTRREKESHQKGQRYSKLYTRYNRGKYKKEEPDAKTKEEKKFEGKERGADEGKRRVTKCPLCGEQSGGTSREHDTGDD